MPLGLLPYCGAPPAPAELAGRWTLEPWVLAALATAAAASLHAARARDYAEQADILRRRVLMTVRAREPAD